MASELRIGEGLYFDGLTAREQKVLLVLEGSEKLRLEPVDHPGVALALWSLNRVQTAPAPHGVTRLSLDGDPSTARLLIADSTSAARIVSLCPAVRGASTREKRLRLKLFGWAMAALASLILLVIYGIPALATSLTPLVPVRLEASLGTVVESQVEAMFTHRGRPSAICTGAQGNAVLEAVVAALVEGSDFAITPRPAILNADIPNAIALPGGRIFVFSGLIKRARSPEEVVAVIAHELGHVQRRHATQQLLGSAGNAFILGLVLGDVTGGGAVIAASRTLLERGYSRDAEREADAFAVAALNRQGQDATPLSDFLERIAGSPQGSLSRYLSTHPMTTERRDNIRDENRPDVSVARGPLLSLDGLIAMRDACETVEGN